MVINKKYGLAFIKDENLFLHVKATITKYHIQDDVTLFNQHLVQPIKASTKYVSYFHRHIVNYLTTNVTKNWRVPTTGNAVINDVERVYIEIKSNYHSMSSASSRKTYMTMQDKILSDKKATCYLVEVNTQRAEAILWQASVDGELLSHQQIKRISINQFYALLTGVESAFQQLYAILPQVINDVVAEQVTG